MKARTTLCILLFGCATRVESEPAAEPRAAGGEFTMEASDVMVDPVGCRVGTREGKWSLNMPFPPESGEWLATETFDAYENDYRCSGDPDAFECINQTAVDYSQRGVDARVELVVTYEGRFSTPQALDGTFDLLFSCDGSACDEIAGDWTVASFPCANSGRFAGEIL